MNIHLQAWNRDYSVYSKIQNIKLKCKLQTGKYFKYLWQSLYVTNTKKDLHTEKKERNNSNDRSVAQHCEYNYHYIVNTTELYT